MYILLRKPCPIA